jgi:hypothetical protein
LMLLPHASASSISICSSPTSSYTLMPSMRGGTCAREGGGAACQTLRKVGWLGGGRVGRGAGTQHTVCAVMMQRGAARTTAEASCGSIHLDAIKPGRNPGGEEQGICVDSCVSGFGGATRRVSGMHTYIAIA